MKKISCLFLVLLLILCGCNVNDYTKSCSSQKQMQNILRNHLKAITYTQSFITAHLTIRRQITRRISTAAITYIQMDCYGLPACHTSRQFFRINWKRVYLIQYWKKHFLNLVSKLQLLAKNTEYQVRYSVFFFLCGGEWI